MIATTAPICDVPRILADMRVANGAAARQRFAQAEATGSAVVSGLRGSARFAYDLRTGRYAQRFDVAVMGKSAEIYDGRTVWAKDISGGVHAYDAWFPRARARTDAFVLSGAYLNARSGAAYRCFGTRSDDGRRVVVVRVTPRGGIPAELAIDARTHLLASVTERFPITTMVTRYADYRTVDGVVLPFSIAQGTLAEPDDGYVFTVRRYALETQADGAAFAPPKPDANGAIAGGAASTTMPIAIEGRQLFVWASIDGHAPMPFILDTGGHAILTTGAAKTLGLRTAGAGESGGASAGTISLQYTRVRSIRLGKAELFDQPMLVIPYPYEFYERGRRQPLAGILGLEIFEHFVARIDYGDRTLALSSPLGYRYRGGGTAVPLRFQDDTPLVRAAADGKPGTFDIDTGNAGALILYGDFLARTGLGELYRGGSTVIGHGTGGTNTGRLETLHAYAIGGHTIRNVRTDFTFMTKGAFASWTEAGNAGYEVLSRFIPTFDYARETLYLEPCARDCVPPANWSGMAFEKNEPAQFVVSTVVPGGPAARAGIAAGDRIVAIDGKPAADFSRADLVALVTAARPTTLTLTIVRGTAKQTRILVKT